MEQRNEARTACLTLYKDLEKKLTAQASLGISTAIIDARRIFTGADYVLNSPKLVENYPYEKAVYQQLAIYMSSILKILNANPPEASEAQIFKIKQINQQAQTFLENARWILDDKKSPETVAEVIQKLPAIKEYTPLQEPPKFSEKDLEPLSMEFSQAKERQPAADRETTRKGMVYSGMMLAGLGLSTTGFGFLFLPLIIPGIIATLAGTALIVAGQLIYGKPSSEKEVNLNINTDDSPYPPVSEQERHLTVASQKTETEKQDLTTLSAAALVEKFESIQAELGKKVKEEGREFGIEDPQYDKHNKFSLRTQHTLFSFHTDKVPQAKYDVFSSNSTKSDEARKVLIAEIEKTQTTLADIEKHLEEKATTYTKLSR